MLLTGMSDGGTFTYVSGLRAASPFTHLAPIAASFHPMMLEMIDRPEISGRPIYLTHGTHDWMFDVEVAHLANQVLSGMGAEMVFREIPDLAHTYPRDENPRILDWFLE
jgi:phospholipase/carboxylesterase